MTSERPLAMAIFASRGWMEPLETASINSEISPQSEGLPYFGSGVTVIEPSFGRTICCAISKTGELGFPTSKKALRILAKTESGSSSNRIAFPGSDLDIL